jgi:predicted transcriptional regulator
MVITLDPELEAALNELARRQGVAPETLALNALRERFLAAAALQPRDEWERGLLAVARDCGVSLPDSALSSEGLYE